MLNTVASFAKAKRKIRVGFIDPSASVADAVRAMNDENVRGGIRDGRSKSCGHLY